ncbi:MAG TPA: hypothetical protein VE133_17965 [Candidatus Sulfotelmatobacter sp.]|jgi:hypothetical protein|nr:hypothetical protein [Candidatus Sulfotelmatobacter sp.]
MPGVLTTGSNVTCGHAGTVSTSGSDKLKVSGNPALLKTGIASKSISSCATPAASDVSGPTAIPCSTVSSVATGEATKLKISGAAVMLDTLTGQTDGMVGKVTPQLLLSATAVQSKLKAV